MVILSTSDERLSRLQALSDFLSTIPLHTPTHFEMASFGDAACLGDIVKHVVIPHVNSLGLNEQELPIILAILSSNDMGKIRKGFTIIQEILLLKLNV